MQARFLDSRFPCLCSPDNSFSDTTIPEWVIEHWACSIGPRHPMKRNHRRIVLLILSLSILLLVAFVAACYLLPARLIGLIRDRTSQIARERFHADVQFGTFDITLTFPRLVILAENVALSRRNDRGTYTLIFVRKLAVDADLLQFFRTPAHVRRVQLQGMNIHVPPRGERGARQPATPVKERYPLIVDHVECNECQLNLLPRQPDKEPLEFAIHHLMMQKVGLGRSAPYQATLTNAVPRGEIDVRGEFGPWQPDEPSLTSLSGNYVFKHADLNPFPGIAGTLDSKGRFEGLLERIVADGETTTPDFALDVSDHPVPLNTQFHAIIDGTSGDTALDPVNAQFLNSHILAHGGVFGVPGKKGKAVLLDVVVDPGRLEDMLYLGVKSHVPAMTGNLKFRTKLAIPPGKEKISDRLKLDGQFVSTSTRPTSLATQEKLKQLSRKAEGKPKDPTAGTDLFDLKGRFILSYGDANFPSLNFSIPGAKLDLKGKYQLHSEDLNFFGTLHLSASLSHTVTGVKSFFLKAVDPFFKDKNGGSALPIKITGRREKPEFGLAFHQPKEQLKNRKESGD